MMLSLKCVKAISRVKGASDFQIQVVEDGFVRVVALASNRTVVSEQTFPIDADPDDFPSIPTWPTPTISVRGLRAAIDDVSAVTAPDAGRYAMNGVCIDFKRGNVVATDGKRLHLRHVPDLNQSRPEVVVPCGAQISRFVDTTLMMGVSISEDGRLIGAEFGPERMFDLEYYVFWQGCAIEGEFPPYMDVLPQHETWTVEWFMTPDEIKHLIGWIKSSGAMNSRELLAMIMEFTTEQISVMFRDPQQGTSRTTIHPKDLVARKAVEIGFNPRLLVDALSHPDVRRMCVKDAKSAAEIDGPDLRNIVMPIQVV
jgi:DNA polymerase III sliding clamp (beta) subunit (PCNA family)